MVFVSGGSLNSGGSNNNNKGAAFATTIADNGSSKSHSTSKSQSSHPFIRRPLSFGNKPNPSSLSSSGVTADTASVSTSSTTSTTTEGDDNSFSISLWLLPSPTDKARTELGEMITNFSNRHPAASVPFQPHVTLVGGTKCPSQEFLDQVLLPRLRDGIQHSSSSLNMIGSSIPIQFEPDPVFKDQWNQACVLVMEESLAFTQLVQLCRELMATALAEHNDNSNGGGDGESATLIALPRDHYPPPLHKPHMSLYYGDEGIPTLEEIQHGLFGDSSSSSASRQYSFEASQVAVWKTDPGSTEGVAEWEELAIIDLPSSY